MTFFQWCENVTSEEAGVQRQSKLPGDDQITKSSEPDSHSAEKWMDPFVLGLWPIFQRNFGPFFFQGG